MKPQAEKIISFEYPCLLEGSKTETTTGYGFEPGAKKNYWDTGDEEDDSQNGFTRVGGSANKLWDD